jgi:hypothetical protein
MKEQIVAGINHSGIVILYSTVNRHRLEVWGKTPDARFG